MRALILLLSTLAVAHALESCPLHKKLDAPCTCPMGEKGAAQDCSLDQVCLAAGGGCVSTPPPCEHKPFSNTDEVSWNCLCGPSANAPLCVDHEVCELSMVTWAFECKAAPPACGESQAAMEPVAEGERCTCGVGAYPFEEAAVEPGFDSRCHQASAHNSRPVPQPSSCRADDTRQEESPLFWPHKNRAPHYHTSFLSGMSHRYFCNFAPPHMMAGSA